MKQKNTNPAAIFELGLCLLPFGGKSHGRLYFAEENIHKHPPPTSQQEMGFRPLQSSTPPALLTLAWRKNHWFPCKMTSKKQVQKFHTDDTSLPSAMRETWLKRHNQSGALPRSG